ncbi:MAG: acetyl-CoA carboxylase biotin carboxylase subunit [Pseudomonadota bacterium]
MKQPQPPFRKVLIANRGEIAVRVMRSCRERGVKTVAVYSDADRAALHVRFADEAYHIGPSPSRDSYLVAERILDVAKKSGAQAIHPGYGFLSENAGFAQAVADAGLVFIGPPPAAIEAIGHKTRARELMDKANVPVVPGTTSPIADVAEALKIARDIGFPVMLKAAAGGGGKGMRRIDKEEKFNKAFEAASREAVSSFGDGAVYLEKFLEKPRHVEIQIFADGHGNAVHLFERECSVQRRHQKIIEESPSCVVDPEMRRRMGEVAVQAARAVGYVNAGTVEFLVDAHRHFYFLEMNTRLQVEHPVTEWITGLDLVSLQLDVAAGLPLPLEQIPTAPRGHAIEARIYAEDPYRQFLPQPGRIDHLRVPTGPFVRDDSGVYPGSEVTPFYDPMIAKLSVWGTTRDQAIARLDRALEEYTVKGLTTNIAFLRQVLANEVFRSGEYDTGLIEQHMDLIRPSVDEAKRDVALLAAALFAHNEAARVALPQAAQSSGRSTWRRVTAMHRNTRW